ncbi:hypothetical protein C7S20_05600 [Christiangramia fulva]|uniref:Uncharacterized protein n=2 Tax=Christiangramia fulva TaxID=2126553 RepID=A0A2R3Z3J1_9FLAO|nr:hypothetical protein C7S20_05600 [Christiangramia fulva]
MKKSLKIVESPESEIEIKVVSDFNNYDHKHVYQIFPIGDDKGLIGAEDGENFAINIKSNLDVRFGWSIYLDGINVIQSYGIKSLSDIPENERDNYDRHVKFLGETEGNHYSHCYSQLNGENRRFTFTTKKGSGINEVLLNDPSHSNRIEIYLWREERDSDYDELPFAIEDKESESKIGAGETTYTKFEEGENLRFPVFLGKITILHQEASRLKDSRNRIIQDYANDPMDKVPKT